MTTEAKVLQQRIRGLCDRLRTVQADQPGQMVLVDPAALVDALEAIMAGKATTPEQIERSTRRVKMMGETLKSGRFSVYLWAPGAPAEPT